MLRLRRWLVVGLCLGSLSASAHLCNNIYRTPDRVIVKAEKPVAIVDQSDEFRVFCQNNYHTYLHNVRLAAQIEGGDGVQVDIQPAAVAEMTAGQRVSFNVKLTVAPGTPKGGRRLVFAISANEIGFKPLAEPSVEELRSASQNGNHSPAIMAAESLIRRGDPSGFEKLSSWARQDNPDYRGRSIRALGKAGNKEHIEFLRTLLAERNGWIRGNALLALGLLKDEPTTFLSNTADRDAFVKAAAQAGLALAGYSGPQLDEALRGGLSDPNVYVRIACGWALAAQRDKTGVAALDAAFRTNDPQQRTTAGDALVDVANRPTVAE
ncbi:MAG: HEAT repeat domain-containing protein [Fimbriimonadaceae bacterium]|nr:HEAT repeat domain-containing protein [Fimbriimonadaceae bacterium]